MSASIELGWNNGKLQAGAAGAAAIVDKASRQMKSALASIGSGLSQGIGMGAGIVSVQGLASALKNAVVSSAQATIAFDSMRIGMTVVEQSAEGASRRMEELQELAKLPGLGFEQAVQGDIRLRSAGISASVSKRAIEEMGNALAAVGKGKADMDGIILALSQIASKGKVSAEEINQIAERVPQIRAILKSTFGTADTEAIQKMNIPVESFITLVVDGFSRAVPRAIVGLQGKIDNFSDALRSNLASFGAGIAEELVGPLDDATDSMGRLNDKASDAGSSVGSFIAAWKEQFTSADAEADGLLQSFANLFATDYWQQHDKLVAKTKQMSEVISEQKKKTDEATESVKRAAAQDKEWAKQREDLNAALDVYVAKQDAANAKAEAAAEVALKQAEATEKLEEALAKAKDQSSYSSMSPKMQQQQEVKKLDRLDQAIDTEKLFGNKDAALKLEIEREGVLLRIGDLEEKIRADTQKQVDADERLALATKKREEAHASSLQMLDLELAILNAQASGHDRKAKQLEHQRDVQEETARIVADTGLAYEDAARKAEQLVSAKEKVANGRDGNGRRKIHGYSQEQDGAGDTIGAGFRRAEKRRNDSRNAANKGVLEYMGMDSMGPSRLTPRAEIGARTPATDAPKASGESEIAAVIKGYTEQTIEIFKQALA